MFCFFFSTNFCLWSRSSQTIHRPGRVNCFILFLRNDLSFCDVFRVLGFSMFNFFFSLFPSVKQVSKSSICKVKKDGIEKLMLKCNLYTITFSVTVHLLSTKKNLHTHLRRWEHQRGWLTSEQPGGPEAQQQPHPPKTTIKKKLNDAYEALPMNSFKQHDL